MLERIAKLVAKSLNSFKDLVLFANRS